MAHISIDLPSISSSQKKKLISEMRNLLSDIADIEVSEISVSLHELPLENMNGTSSYEENKKEVKEKEPKNTTIEESLTKQNENLLNWVLKLIEHNGFKIPEQIPYFKMVRNNVQLRYYEPQKMYGELIEEKYIIPSIEITKINNRS